MLRLKFQNTIDCRLTGRHKKSLLFIGTDRIDNRSILDIGCANGWFERWALENGCKEVIGIEPTSNGFSNARKEVPTATFLQGSALSIPLEERSVDMAVMWEVLEHLPKRTEEAVFKEIHRVLKDGGVLFLSTPNMSFWSCVLDPAWVLTGHRHYTSNKMRSIADKTGFEIKRIEYGGGYWEQLSMILLYVFKWVFRREIPWKRGFELQRNREYLPENKGSRSGFVTLFIEAKKLR